MLTKEKLIENLISEDGTEDNLWEFVNLLRDEESLYWELSEDLAKKKDLPGSVTARQKAYELQDEATSFIVGFYENYLISYSNTDARVSNRPSDVPFAPKRVY